MAMFHHLAGALRAATGRIFDLSILGTHNRIHTELLRIAIPAEDGANTAIIHPVPVHADIASRVSTTRETVARVLGDLGRQGLVQRDGDSLVVRDFEALTRIVKEFKG
jgi:CRP-like cAMP-binding protein